MNRSEGFHICLPRLSNLVIRDCKGKHHIFASELVSLLYIGYYPLHFWTESLCLLEKVDLCIQIPNKEDAHKIFGLLQQLHSVKFLKLNLEAVEVYWYFVLNVYNPSYKILYLNKNTLHLFYFLNKRATYYNFIAGYCNV